jgi:hypothetical protein
MVWNYTPLITEVSYMFPTPSDPKPVAKVSFVATAAGVGCGVGYYKALAPTSPREPSDTDDGLLTASEVWPDMIHAWHLFYQQVAAGRDAAAVGAFIRSMLG